MFADAHLHMTDPEFDDGYDDIDDSVLLFSNTSSPKEFRRLQGLSSHDGRVVPFYGTHPWFIEEYDRDALYDILSTDPKANVGEIGLDTKRGSIGEQLPVFMEQLDLAQSFDRSVSIHMVGSEEYVLRELRKRKLRAILHSYSSPEGYTDAFAGCGCYFSISQRIFSKGLEKVVSILRSIPMDRLLLETDAPSDHNNCVTISGLAEDVGNAIGMDTEKVMGITLENARRLIL